MCIRDRGVFVTVPGARLQYLKCAWDAKSHPSPDRVVHPGVDALGDDSWISDARIALSVAGNPPGKLHDSGVVALNQRFGPRVLRVTLSAARQLVIGDKRFVAVRPHDQRVADEMLALAVQIVSRQIDVAQSNAERVDTSLETFVGRDRRRFENIAIVGDRETSAVVPPILERDFIRQSLETEAELRRPENPALIVYPTGERAGRLGDHVPAAHRVRPSTVPPPPGRIEHGAVGEHEERLGADVECHVLRRHRCGVEHWEHVSLSDLGLLDERHNHRDEGRKKQWSIERDAPDFRPLRPRRDRQDECGVALDSTGRRDRRSFAFDREIEARQAESAGQCSARSSRRPSRLTADRQFGDEIIVEGDRELRRIDRGRREADLAAPLHHPVEDGAWSDARCRGGEAFGAGAEVFTLDEKDEAGQPSDDNEAAEQGAANYSSAQRRYVRANVVSPLIHSRYLSRPASTGSARSSGTL